MAVSGAAAGVRTPSTSTTTVGDVAFFNVHHGYGVIVTSRGARCAERVGMTTDGGSRFTSFVTVVSAPCTNPEASSLAFDDHGDGFLYAPDLFVTHDGGATWQRSPQPGSVLSVEALGHSIWMLEAVRNVPRGSTKSLLLFESSNGGRTWHASPVPKAAPSEGATETGAWLVRISQTSAYVGTEPGFRDGHGIGTTPMWLTTNSGATWSGRPIPCDRAAQSVAVSAAPEGTLFAECAGEPGAGGQQRETMRSVDGGRIWQVRSPFAQSNGYVSVLDAVSARTAYLTGGRNTVEVTHDGGIHWTGLSAFDIGFATGGMSQIIFFSVADGIVVGQGELDGATTIWSTTDGGAHWTTHEPRIVT